MTRFDDPRPAPNRSSASAAALPSLTAPIGSPTRAPISSRSESRCKGMFTAPIAIPVFWSTRVGTPKPAAAISGVRSSSTTSTRASTSAACDDVGVATSSVRPTSPDGSTIPARILVPPRSTPITCVLSNSAGYPTSPDGAGREALPRLQGRTRQGQGAGGLGAEAPPSRAPWRRGPDPFPRPGRAPLQHAEAAAVAPHRPAHPARPDRAVRRLGGHELLLVLGRRERREQAPRPARARGARAPERPAALARVEHPRARNRQRPDRAARRRPPLRLDHARAQRPAAPPSGLPVDPAGHGRLDPRRRHGKDQRGDAIRGPGTRDPHGA